MICRLRRRDIVASDSDIIFATKTREANTTRRKPNITAKQYHSPQANITEKSHPLTRMAFFLAHPYKIDPYRKFFRNRSMFLSQRIDLSLGDDELRKSPKRDVPTIPVNEVYVTLRI